MLSEDFLAMIGHVGCRALQWGGCMAARLIQPHVQHGREELAFWSSQTISENLTNGPLDLHRSRQNPDDSDWGKNEIWLLSFRNRYRGPQTKRLRLDYPSNLSFAHLPPMSETGVARRSVRGYVGLDLIGSLVLLCIPTPWKRCGSSVSKYSYACYW